MFTTEGLLAFHGWTQMCYRVLFEHTAQLSPEEFSRPLEGFGFPSVREQLMHIAICENYWVTRAQGLEYVRWDDTGLVNGPAIWAAYQPVALRTREWIGGMSPEELLTPRTLLLPGDFSAQVAPAPMLHHVLTHGFHHKGQVVAMCRILGHPAPETDLDMVFLD